MIAAEGIRKHFGSHQVLKGVFMKYICSYFSTFINIMITFT